MELLSPAGNIEKLYYAYEYGADAAYIGIKNFSLRAKADNFSADEYEAIRRVKGNKKLYTALNIYFHDSDIETLEKESDYIHQYPLDGFIVSDIGILGFLKKNFPDKELHLSTQANCVNTEAAKMYRDMGIKRIVLGRELSLKEIEAIKNNVPNVSAVLLLSELETGFPIAFIEGTMLSNIRTAAMSALAAKYLANKSPEDIGFIGSGEQAKSHFLAMKSMFASLKRCRISSVSSASNQYFISQMKHFCPDVEIIDCGCDYKDAVSYADIIITAISGQEPLLKADYIKYGAFYCHVGGYEDEFAVAKKASKIVCDSWETVKHRTQTISRMYKQGLLKDNDIHADLYEIVIGEKVGRESPSEFIYYNGVGLSFIDVAIGKWAFDRVVTIGLGENILLQDKSMFE